MCFFDGWKNFPGREEHFFLPVNLSLSLNYIESLLIIHIIVGLILKTSSSIITIIIPIAIFLVVRAMKRQIKNHCAQLEICSPAWEFFLTRQDSRSQRILSLLLSRLLVHDSIVIAKDQKLLSPAGNLFTGSLPGNFFSRCRIPGHRVTIANTG